MERYNVVVGAIVIESDAVLLLQRSLKETFLPGAWGIPAGKASYGEPLHDAVIRELREEAGLEGEVRAVSGSTWFESQLGGDRIRSVQVNFVVHVDSREVRLDQSNQNYMWVKLENLHDPKLPLDDFTRDALAGALELARQPASANSLNHPEHSDEHLSGRLASSWIPVPDGTSVDLGHRPGLS